MSLTGLLRPEDDGIQDTRLRDRINILLLVLLLCVTRLPYLGIAEPDSSLFVIGARQWLHQGPGALMIYSGQVCALYYATVIGLVKGFALSESSLPALMSLLSFLACLGSVIIGYVLGVKFLSRQPAFWAMVLFSLSPGLWWTSIEPHPQVPSLFFALLSMWLLTLDLKFGSNLIWLVFSACSLGISVALKNDAVLLVPAVLAFSFVLRPNWRTVLTTIAVIAAAAVISLLLGHTVLGSGSSAFKAGQQTATSVLGIPGPVELLKQAMPVVLGLGLFCFLLVTISLLRLLRDRRQSHTWWILISLWCLPGYLFYLLVSGNNIRHVVAFGVPLFWLIGRYIQPRFILGFTLASFLVPGNSNMIMYPSPNVPNSYRLFLDKQKQLETVAQELQKRNSCFSGSYTNDYVTSDLLANGGSVVSQSDVWDTKVTVKMLNGTEVRLNRIDPTQRFLDTTPCRSLEYDKAHKKFRFLGSEWRLPIS